MLVGEILGRYRVVEPLGEGSMATVYAGEHVVLGHRVAIKIMHPEYMHESHMERRLLREARALAAIRHPGIVQLVDIGRGPGGRAYIIMELLQGETLSYRLRGGPLSERQTLIFARQIASALAAAHDYGIVHRDLKPENVFIVPDPAVQLGERAKIIDFGISKRAPVHMGMTPPITRIGVVVGTPEYMSPEQCAGDEVDARSDVYSLGVVMYQMATGILPFAGSTGELIAHHRYVESPRPKSVAKTLSDPLDELISRCLAKQASARYPGMAAIVDALDRIDGVAALPEPDTDLYRLEEEAAKTEDETDPRGVTLEIEAEPASPAEDVFEATYDLPPPRRYEVSLATALVAAVAIALLAIGGFTLMRSRGPGSAAAPPVAASAPSLDGRGTEVAAKPDPDPEPAAKPGPQPEPQPWPEPQPMVAANEPAHPARETTKKKRAPAKRRAPAKPPREEPKETFTDVVTPTVF